MFGNREKRNFLREAEFLGRAASELQCYTKLSPTLTADIRLINAELADLKALKQVSLGQYQIKLDDWKADLSRIQDRIAQHGCDRLSAELLVRRKLLQLQPRAEQCGIEILTKFSNFRVKIFQRSLLFAYESNALEFVKAQIFASELLSDSMRLHSPYTGDLMAYALEQFDSRVQLDQVKAQSSKTDQTGAATSKKRLSLQKNLANTETSTTTPTVNPAEAADSDLVNWLSNFREVAGDKSRKQARRYVHGLLKRLRVHASWVEAGPKRCKLYMGELPYRITLKVPYTKNGMMLTAQTIKVYAELQNQKTKNAKM